MLNKIDHAILTHLQKNAALSIAALSDLVGLTTTPCWKRLKRLEDEGYIERRVAIVNQRKVGLPVTVFVSIRTGQHDEKWLAQFAKSVMALPEVLEFYRMSGDVDYLLKVVTTDIDGYDKFYKKLIRIAQFIDVSSSFAMETIKCSTALPLDLVSEGAPKK